MIFMSKTKNTKSISIRIPADLHDQLEQERKTAQASLTAVITNKLRWEESMDRIMSRVVTTNKSMHEQTRHQIVELSTELLQENQALAKEVADLRIDLRSLTDVTLRLCKCLDQKLEEPMRMGQRLKTLFRKEEEKGKNRNT